MNKFIAFLHGVFRVCSFMSVASLLCVFCTCCVVFGVSVALCLQCLLPCALRLCFVSFMLLRVLCVCCIMSNASPTLCFVSVALCF